MKCKVGQIWLRSETPNYFVITDSEGDLFHILCISGDRVGYEYQRRESDFAERYELIIDCIECGTSRIRHANCSELARDGKCWSCV